MCLVTNDITSIPIMNSRAVLLPTELEDQVWLSLVPRPDPPGVVLPGTWSIGLGLLFPKYYLIFYSEFPKLLLNYSLRVDPLFHEILLTVSQKRQKQTRQKYTCYTNPTQKFIKDLSKLSVDSMVDPVAEWVDMGHSETESESTELTIYISMTDSVKFCWSQELFFGWLCKLLFIPGIILIPSTAYYSANYSRTIGSGLLKYYDTRLLVVKIRTTWIWRLYFLFLVLGYADWETACELIDNTDWYSRYQFVLL